MELTGTLDDEVVKLLEIRFGSELSEVDALLTDPTSGLTAEAYANGQRIVLSSDTFTGVSDDQSIVSHEVSHTLQTDTSLTDPETGALSAEQISSVQDRLGISVVVKDENGVVRGADSITLKAKIELQQQLDGTFRRKIVPPGQGSFVGRLIDVNGDPVSQAELNSLSASGATNSTVFTNRTGSFILAEEPISTVQVDPSTPTRVRVGVGQ